MKFSSQRYVGFSSDLKRRILEHNKGKDCYTCKFKPWKIIYYCAFQNKKKALDFERYLKTASGKAFYRKRLVLSPFKSVFIDTRNKKIN